MHPIFLNRSGPLRLESLDRPSYTVSLTYQVLSVSLQCVRVSQWLDSMSSRCCPCSLTVLEHPTGALITEELGGELSLETGRCLVIGYFDWHLENEMLLGLKKNNSQSTYRYKHFINKNLDGYGSKLNLCSTYLLNATKNIHKYLYKYYINLCYCCCMTFKYFLALPSPNLVDTDRTVVTSTEQMWTVEGETSDCSRVLM